MCRVWGVLRYVMKLDADVDLDLDGDQDVVLGSGSHPLPTMQPVFFYRNEGNHRFKNITPMEDVDFYGKFHGMAL